MLLWDASRRGLKQPRGLYAPEMHVLPIVPIMHLKTKKIAKQICFAIRCFAGGDDGDRTHDLNIANVALSQLSYIPSGY